MIPAPFEYARAESVDHAIELLGSSDDAKILAGGHSLLPLMKVRFAQPSLLVDIGRIGDLSYVREDGDVIAIGALTRHHDVANSELLQSSARSWRTRPARSATRRSGTWARSAARSRTPTRRRTCPR